MKIQIEIRTGQGFIGNVWFFLWIENIDKHFILKFDLFNRVLVNRKYIKEKAV